MIYGRSASGHAECPRCGTAAVRVHSSYSRRLADTAVAGWPVVIKLQVRRFFCGVDACPVKTFAEQIPGLTTRYARRTPLLRKLLEAVAIALAGRAGARLATRLGVVVGRSTLLRLIRAIPDPQIGDVAVLGVDDFALRRGHVYGTVLVDMDSHRPVDLLPDREADAFADWLRAHPGAKVICRDRAGAYAEGGRTGAPEAIQVADRWHLWHNLAKHVDKTVAAHRGCLTPLPAVDSDSQAEEDVRQPAPVLVMAVEQPLDHTPDRAFDATLDVCGRERRLVTRTRERYAAVCDLLAKGESLAGIGRTLGLDRKTVQRFARATSLDELLVKATARASKLDPFKPYLHQRWNQGCTDIPTLHAELQAQGWSGSVQAVRRYFRPFRHLALAPPTTPAIPKPREITRWILTHPDHLDTDAHTKLDEARSHCPELKMTATHVSTFAEMMAHLNGDKDRLEAWMSSVDADDLPHLHSFTTGLRRDVQAVINGLTTRFNSGPVEGIVNKIKYLKRQMFGRANFDLLRKRVLLA
ncbi:ISL3 family transposase [Actinopolymorpha pittospori]|uniref:ISL3 family transposase n=1 Tax=Actinopolymorpha pittospori TaxID=648752 RepID=UPI0030808B36